VDFVIDFISFVNPINTYTNNIFINLDLNNIFIDKLSLIKQNLDLNNIFIIFKQKTNNNNDIKKKKICKGLILFFYIITYSYIYLYILIDSSL